ncbi:MULTISPECIES: ImmA/IrrE family metallo-endopeptidase [Rhizobium]|uniref:ImmA/IrrE family metallo-endopeptidase n=1 Tax=Rhizobium TaxID=379 RepID=UPI0015BE6CA1|nr:MULTISPECIES: ImmA/IrrE family metallo-endopeptidase [Rhizobium]MBY3422553.1 ImmA/IrrE family metallo-endopeptidase [Rhizobium laguerreae]MBY3569334.1 ImmA/IrrE family metallo-endopeptidase [Rhizobium laguerreae]MBY5822035.1 ImmA/IrrE family metallo-endopeptidase [Rhizobium leguminosarum]
MNSSDKGDSLEDAFYLYLMGQKERGELIYGAYPPENCEIFQKREYFCREREANVEFDIVLELRATGRLKPLLHVIFECKNYSGSIPELYVNDFSSKIGRIFPHSAKGVMVISSRLQSGAEKVAKNKGLGIVKYDPLGLEIIADRKARPYIEHGLAERQIFRGDAPPKSLKFSAYFDGKFFGSIGQLLGELHPELSDGARTPLKSIPFLPAATIQHAVHDVLKSIDYGGGPVDLKRICRTMSINLQISDRRIQDADGAQILGSAYFDRKEIHVNADGYLYRERFTLGHEIGHFALQHQVYLSSENIIERDLLITKEADAGFNIERLEFQANAFSSSLLLPEDVFKRMTAQYRRDIGMRDRGHGYIFVDDQPSNISDYDQLLSSLSAYFEASKRAVEVKFKQLGLLTDLRKRNQKQPIPQLLDSLISNWNP